MRLAWESIVTEGHQMVRRSRRGRESWWNGVVSFNQCLYIFTTLCGLPLKGKPGKRAAKNKRERTHILEALGPQAYVLTQAYVFNSVCREIPEP